MAMVTAAINHSVKILNTFIDNVSIQELLEQLDRGVVVTPNVDHLMRLQGDASFYNLYLKADYRVCDSQILLYASYFLGTPLKEKISGSDFFPIFCNYHRANRDITVFLLGGKPGVARQAQININHRIGRDIIVESLSPSFGFEQNELECLQIVEMINRSRATVLAVGVGSPKQENWIEKYRAQLPHVKIYLAIGATIDFEAGRIRRAPKWMSRLGVEWLFRLYCEPKRLWKRYLVEDLPFLWLLFQQKTGLYRAPEFSHPEPMRGMKPLTKA